MLWCSAPTAWPSCCCVSLPWAFTGLQEVVRPGVREAVPSVSTSEGPLLVDKSSASGVNMRGILQHCPEVLNLPEPQLSPALTCSLSAALPSHVTASPLYQCFLASLPLQGDITGKPPSPRQNRRIDHLTPQINHLCSNPSLRLGFCGPQSKAIHIQRRVWNETCILTRYPLGTERSEVGQWGSAGLLGCLGVGVNEDGFFAKSVFDFLRKTYSICLFF